MYLGSTDDGGEGAFGHVHGALEVIELLLQEETSHGGFEVGGHACRQKERQGKANRWVSDAGKDHDM